MEPSTSQVYTQKSRTLISSITVSFIPHLEAILSRVYPPAGKFKYIFDRMFQRFEETKEALANVERYLDLQNEMERDLSLSKSTLATLEDLSIYFEKPINRVKQGPNPYCIWKVLEFLSSEILNPSLGKILASQISQIRLCQQVLILWRRMEMLLFYLNKAVVADKNDVVNVPEDHPLKQELQKVMSTVNCGSESDHKKYYASFSLNLHIIQISIARGTKSFFDLAEVTEE